MITRDQLKAQIDGVCDEYLEALHRIIRALEERDTARPDDWDAFVGQTFGCMSDDPIERGSQGTMDPRAVMQ